MATSIGERIKSLRNEQSLTLANLSEKTNLSVSYLSQVERDKTTPSLSSLVEIAKALDANLRYFFEANDERTFVIRSVVNHTGENFNQSSEIFALSPVDEPSRLRVWQYKLGPRRYIRGTPEADSEKFCYILKGKLTMEIGEEVLTLDEGDSVAFDATHSYTWRNDGEDICSFIYGCATMKIER